MDSGGGGRLYDAAAGASDHTNTFLHQTQKRTNNNNNKLDALDPLWLPTSFSSPSFHDSDAMAGLGVDYEGSHEMRRMDQDQMVVADDDDEFSNSSSGGIQPEKKRRLTAEQVQYLEKSFDVENKLDPDRKVKLANQLGLQPRQVSIWFQNRRARFKNKQLEKDYDLLKTDYDALKANYESILKEKDGLKNEVTLLTNKLKQRGNGLAPESDPHDGSSHRDISAALLTTENNVGKVVSVVVACKQEDASSVKSDVLDSESPNGTSDAAHNSSSSLPEPANSSNIFEPEQSDFSRDEDERYLGRSLLNPSLQLPKLEEYYSDDPQCSSGSFGFPAEDQQLWSILFLPDMIYS